MDRPLSSREQQVLVAMIDHAGAFDDQATPTAAARSGWRARVPGLRVDGVCGCGTCPSISLADRSAPAPDAAEGRVVLMAGLTDALVLLFIDRGVPSYLELAPHDDEIVYPEFPDPTTLSF
ncbi:MAG: hypothetical protein QM708_09345 [Propioniciclava sp.]|uniref:hypothetical protein n=1 Tax=Propioniciclava sp. TaxID=2038686 RepID=UPI0039E5AFBE